MSERLWVIAGEPDGALPKVGGVYDVRHSRKGSFTVRVLAVNGEWLEVRILEGTAKAIMTYNVREAGEDVKIRAGHTYLIPRAAEVKP